jgi:type II secretory pathway pseudopilin PulG
MFRRHGLTLVELLVVLTILIILTTVAVVSTDQFLDQARYDATQRTLQNVQSAITGPGGQREPDGTPLITGFVADIGRLPLATADSTGALTLDELWSNPSGLPAFTLQQAPAPDTDVSILCGWRGPYLQLPLGSTQLTDGWGNALSLLQSDGATPITAGMSIPWVRSLGSDNALGGTGYAADTNVTLVSTVAGSPINLYQASLVVNLNFVTQAGAQIVPTPSGSGWTFTANGAAFSGGSFASSPTVTFFGPNNGQTVVHSGQTVFVVSSPNSTPAAGTMTYTFPRPGVATDAITIGPRMVRARCVYTPSGSTAVTLLSPIIPLVLQPGGQTKTITLQLPN